MPLVAHYAFDQTDVSLDSSGNSNNLTNAGVTSTVDSTYGKVALFDGVDDYLTIDASIFPALLGNSARTISVWVNSPSMEDLSIFDYSITSKRFLLYHRKSEGLLFLNTSVRVIVGPMLSINTWYHVSVTYSGTTLKVFVDGSETFSATFSVDSTSQVPLYIGRLSDNAAVYQFSGKMSDFRIYDYELDSSEISSMFSDGPGLSTPSPPLVFTPRVTTIAITISSVSGAIAYRLTSQATGSIEKTEKDGFTDLDQTIKNLSPETEYTFRLYSTDDGTAYTLVETSAVTTLANVGSNYDKNDYLDDTSGIFDLSVLDQTSVNRMSDLLNDIFATGDLMFVKVSGKTKKSKFVNRGGNVDVTDTESVLANFSPDAGSGQNVSFTLSDTSTVLVSYDDATEEVTVDSKTYHTGDSFVLDGRKVTLLDI